MTFTNCTIVGDVAVASSGMAPAPQHVSFLDSILWTDEHNIAATAPPEIDTEYSCVSWSAEGDGVIHSDPLLSAGALGEHYLSHADSDQATTSPCVDAGSVLASESVVAGLTTRTDHEPDTGVVDMGFHYGRRIGPKPYMELGHEGIPICRGSDLTAYVLLKCDGVIMLADIYLAAAYEDTVLYLSDGNWTTSALPWMPTAPIRDYLPDYFSFPIHFPSSIPTGPYTIYLGLFDHHTGELVSLASTEVEVLGLAE
ncbi:hypothetical protein J7M28_08115 [bacterium]|nr:hypothetical protein [bacterium]